MIINYFVKALYYVQYIHHSFINKMFHLKHFCFPFATTLTFYWTHLPFAYRQCQITNQSVLSAIRPLVDFGHDIISTAILHCL